MGSVTESPRTNRILERGFPMNVSSGNPEAFISRYVNRLEFDDSHSLTLQIVRPMPYDTGSADRAAFYEEGLARGVSGSFEGLGLTVLLIEKQDGFFHNDQYLFDGQFPVLKGHWYVKHPTNNGGYDPRSFPCPDCDIGKLMPYELGGQGGSIARMLNEERPLDAIREHPLVQMLSKNSIGMNLGIILPHLERES